MQSIHQLKGKLLQTHPRQAEITENTPSCQNCEKYILSHIVYSLYYGKIGECHKKKGSPERNTLGDLGLKNKRRGLEMKKRQAVSKEHRPGATGMAFTEDSKTSYFMPRIKYETGQQPIPGISNRKLLVTSFRDFTREHKGTQILCMDGSGELSHLKVDKTVTGKRELGWRG